MAKQQKRKEPRKSKRQVGAAVALPSRSRRGSATAAPTRSAGRTPAPQRRFCWPAAAGRA